jgi:AcrR family transcriptional regulator
MNGLYSNVPRRYSSVNSMSSEKPRTYELKARAARQAATRERIVRATVELHKEVGPARTTVAEIARRADVQRLTVYNHFPELGQLLAACQGHWLTRHPPPDPAPALALEKPKERLRGVLAPLYAWYRETAPMAASVRRDRALVPALDSLLAGSMDAGLTELTEALTAGFARRGRAQKRTRAAVALALEFWTWQRLSREALSDEEAAALMASAAANAHQG